MTIELGIIISLVGCIIGIVSFIIGQKKSSKDDGMELGSFIGEIKTELNNIKEMITELKGDMKKFPADVQEKIDRAISDHEKRFHS